MQGTVGLSLVSAMKSSVQQNRNATSSEKDWMAQLLALLSQDCEACYVFCLSIIHAFLYGRLPTEIIHKFGFPKTCSVLNWKPTVLYFPSKRFISTFCSESEHVHGRRSSNDVNLGFTRKDIKRLFGFQAKTTNSSFPPSEKFPFSRIFRVHRCRSLLPMLCF